MFLAFTCSSGVKPAPCFWGLAGVMCVGLLPILCMLGGVFAVLYEVMSVVCLCVSVPGPLSTPPYALIGKLLIDLLMCYVIFNALTCR